MNQKTERLGFFKRMYLAITDFRWYPFVQREKTSVAIWYFVLLILLVAMFLSMSFSSTLFENVSSLLYDYNNVIPEFTFENGELNVDKEIYNVDDDNKFVVDTKYTVEQYVNAKEGEEVLYSNNSIIVNNDGVIYTQNGVSVVYVFPNLNEKITKDSLRSYLEIMNEDWSVRLAIFFVMWLTIFVVYLITKFIMLLLLVLVTCILNFVFGIKLKFNNYMKIVTYAITLPLIVELVSILVIGRVTEYATIACQLLTYVYIFYALRAIKLDVMIMTASGNTIKEKIENIISKLESEVENKIEDENKNLDNDEEESKQENENSEENKDDKKL